MIFSKEIFDIVDRVLAKNVDGEILHVTGDSRKYKLGVDIFDAVRFLKFREDFQNDPSIMSKFSENLERELGVVVVDDSLRTKVDKLKEDMKQYLKEDYADVIKSLIVEELKDNYYLRSNINYIHDESTGSKLLHFCFDFGQFDLIESILVKITLDACRNDGLTSNVDRLKDGMILPVIEINSIDCEGLTILQKIYERICCLKNEKNPAKFKKNDKEIESLQKLKLCVGKYNDVYKNYAKVISNGQSSYFAKTSKEDVEVGEIKRSNHEMNLKNSQVNRKSSLPNKSELLNKFKSDLNKVILDFYKKENHKKCANRLSLYTEPINSKISQLEKEIKNDGSNLKNERPGRISYTNGELASMMNSNIFGKDEDDLFSDGDVFIEDDVPGNLTYTTGFISGELNNEL